MSLTELAKLINSGQEIGISDNNEKMMHFRSYREAGDVWGEKRKELMGVGVVHFQ